MVVEKNHAVVFLPAVPSTDSHGATPEEAMVFHTLLPEVLAVVPLLEVELHNVLVVALQTLPIRYLAVFS